MWLQCRLSAYFTFPQSLASALAHQEVVSKQSLSSAHETCNSSTVPNQELPPAFRTASARALMRLRVLVCTFACNVAVLLTVGLSVLRARLRGGQHRRFGPVDPHSISEEARTSPRPVIPPSSSRPSEGSKRQRPPEKPTVSFPVLKAFDGSFINRSDYLKDFGQLSRKNKVIFVHVPKTGGSTIEDSRLFADAQKFHNTKGHSEAGVLRELAPSFRSFTMVRHPCERFVSAWTYVHTTDAPEPERQWYREHFGRGELPTYVASNFFGSGIFFEFLHFMPQHKFVFFPNKTFGVDLLLCQDNWTRSVERLREYLKPVGVPAEIERKRTLNTTHSKCSELPNKTRQRIEKAYALDMCIFYPTGAPTACDGLSVQELTDRYRNCTLHGPTV